MTRKGQLASSNLNTSHHSVSPKPNPLSNIIHYHFGTITDNIPCLKYCSTISSFHTTIQIIPLGFLISLLKKKDSLRIFSTTITYNLHDTNTISGQEFIKILIRHMVKIIYRCRVGQVKKRNNASPLLLLWSRQQLVDSLYSLFGDLQIN